MPIEEQVDKLRSWVFAGVQRRLLSTLLDLDHSPLGILFSSSPMSKAVPSPGSKSSTWADQILEDEVTLKHHRIKEHASVATQPDLRGILLHRQVSTIHRPAITKGWGSLHSPKPRGNWSPQPSILFSIRKSMGTALYTMTAYPELEVPRKEFQMRLLFWDGFEWVCR